VTKVTDELEPNRSVTYNDIMGWFCNDKLGFGEIELAFKLFKSSDLLVDEIIAMRQVEGLGWGQIKQQIAADDPDNEEYKNPAGKVPPGKIKSEENKNKVKSNKKDDD
jgi:hypothetical protein